MQYLKKWITNIYTKITNTPCPALVHIHKTRGPWLSSHFSLSNFFQCFIFEFFHCFTRFQTWPPEDVGRFGCSLSVGVAFHKCTTEQEILCSDHNRSKSFGGFRQRTAPWKSVQEAGHDIYNPLQKPQCFCLLHIEDDGRVTYPVAIFIFGSVGLKKRGDLIPGYEMLFSKTSHEWGGSIRRGEAYAGKCICERVVLFLDISYESTHLDKP